MNYSVELKTSKEDKNYIIMIKIKESSLTFFESILTINLTNRLQLNEFIQFINNISLNKESLVIFPSVQMNIKLSYYQNKFIFKFYNNNNSFLFRIPETEALKNSFYNIKHELRNMDSQ